MLTICAIILRFVFRTVTFVMYFNEQNKDISYLFIYLFFINCLVRAFFFNTSYLIRNYWNSLKNIRDLWLAGKYVLWFMLGDPPVPSCNSPECNIRQIWGLIKIMNLICNWRWCISTYHFSCSDPENEFLSPPCFSLLCLQQDESWYLCQSCLEQCYWKMEKNFMQIK